MALAAKEHKHHSFPLAFEGLNEKELASLYRLASIKRVNAGDVLLREGDSDTSLRFVLDGSVRIAKNLNGRVREVALLSQSDSLEEIAFMNIRRIDKYTRLHIPIGVDEHQ